MSSLSGSERRSLERAIMGLFPEIVDTLDPDETLTDARAYRVMERRLKAWVKDADTVPASDRLNEGVQQVIDALKKALLEPDTALDPAEELVSRVEKAAESVRAFKAASNLGGLG